MKISIYTEIVIFFGCIIMLTGCGMSEEQKQSNSIFSEIDIAGKIVSIDSATESLDIDVLSENDLQSENISKISEGDFWKLVQRLCKLNNKIWNYEIYATDSKEYALIVLQNGSMKMPFWLYLENSEWHVDNIELPENTAASGSFDYAEFHWVKSWDKEAMLMQTASNQGNGDTFAFLIEENRLRCIGCNIGAVCRYREMLTVKEQTSFYSDEGRPKAVFWDVDNDGVEELIMYARRLTYNCDEGCLGSLQEAETVIKVYQYQKDNLIEISNVDMDMDSLSDDYINETSYHLWGAFGEIKNQVLVKTETDGINSLYSVVWEEKKPLITEIQTIGNHISKTKIANEDQMIFSNSISKPLFVITEQENEKGRIFQVFLWDKGMLTEVFRDEYRSYSLIDEETYLTGDQYNTYSCYIYNDILQMSGTRLILDANGKVEGTEDLGRYYQYQNGKFHFRKK